MAAILRKHEGTVEWWETFDPVKFDAKMEELALATTLRFARGGVALHSGRILTEERFEAELEQLRRKVEATPAS